MDSTAGTDPERLLAGARAGDGQALGQLLERYRNYLTLLARVQIGRRLRGKVEDADLIQDTFLEAHRHFGTFRGTSEGELVSWLRQILAANLANLLRRYYGTRRRDVRLERELAAEASLGGMTSPPASCPSARVGSTPGRECSLAGQVVAEVPLQPAQDPLGPPGLAPQRLPDVGAHLPAKPLLLGHRGVEPRGLSPVVRGFVVQGAVPGDGLRQAQPARENLPRDLLLGLVPAQDGEPLPLQPFAPGHLLDPFSRGPAPVSLPGDPAGGEPRGTAPQGARRARPQQRPKKHTHGRTPLSCPPRAGGCGPSPGVGLRVQGERDPPRRADQAPGRCQAGEGFAWRRELTSRSSWPGGAPEGGAEDTAHPGRHRWAVSTLSGETTRGR
jgi:hypothetical protein